MKKFIVKKWKAAKIVNGKQIEVEESMVDIIMTIIRLGGDSICPGIDNFRIMRKISIALNKSDETGHIELEDDQYKFIMMMIVKYIPHHFAFSPDTSNAIEEFLNLPSI